MNITEFLEARIAEDENLAQAILDRSAPDAWDNPMETGNFWPEEVRFLDQHSPARVLAECAAKRAIIEMWEDPESFGPLPDGVDAGAAMATDDAVKALAAIYKDHPDYQQEWSA